jgi:hypothetical protein
MHLKKKKGERLKKKYSLGGSSEVNEFIEDSQKNLDL